MKEKAVNTYDKLSGRTEVACLIFDFDGTLADTEEAHREAFNSAFSAKKLKWHWNKYLYKKLLQVAGGKERIKVFNEEFLSKSNQIRSEDIEELYYQKTKLFLQLISRGYLRLRPGVRELLEKAKYNKKKLAIATSTNMDNVKSLVRACLGEKPENIFSFISTGEMVEKKKPSPDLYNLVLAEMELLPSECLAFEDSRIGLISAKRASIETIVSPSYYNMDDNFEEADFLLKSFSLKDFPNSLQQRLFF